MNKKPGNDEQRGRDASESGPRSFSASGIVTLTTDFGTADYFVAAVKGVLLSRNPLVKIVDITHEIPPQDIADAAFTLLAVQREFPAGTIHVAVVDPGVGSKRLPIVVEADGQFFVGPDNGIFSFVCERAQHYRAWEVSNEKLFRHPVSTTFHGRDIFAPIAAALSRGEKPEEVGGEVSDLVKLDSIVPQNARPGRLKGRILHIDRFGNCVTNFSRADLDGDRIELSLNGKSIEVVRNFYAEAKPGELFAIWGSAGFLEIAIKSASAAKKLKAKRGDTVKLRTR